MYVEWIQSLSWDLIQKWFKRKRAKASETDLVFWLYQRSSQHYSQRLIVYSLTNLVCLWLIRRNVLKHESKVEYTKVSWPWHIVHIRAVQKGQYFVYWGSCICIQTKVEIRVMALIFFVVALKVANIGVVAKQVLRTGHSLLIRHINGLLMATTVGH